MRRAPLMFAALCYLPCCRSAAEGQDRPCRPPSFIHSTPEGSEDLHLVGTNHCAEGGGTEHVASARSCSEDPSRHYRCDTMVAEEQNPGCQGKGVCNRLSRVGKASGRGSALARET